MIEINLSCYIQTDNKLITDSETRDDNVPRDRGNNRPSV